MGPRAMTTASTTAPGTTGPTGQTRPLPEPPVYNLTDGPGYTATNDPLKWNYAHWGGFNPGLYGGACVGL